MLQDSRVVLGILQMISGTGVLFLTQNAKGLNRNY